VTCKLQAKSSARQINGLLFLYIPDQITLPLAVHAHGVTKLGDTSVADAIEAKSEELVS